jgi:hypothetical protein
MLRPFRVNGLSPSRIILHFGGSALLLPQQNSAPAVNRMGMRGDKGMRREGALWYLPETEHGNWGRSGPSRWTDPIGTPTRAGAMRGQAAGWLPL